MAEAGESQESIRAFIHAKNGIGQSPIHAAAERKHLDCAELLLKEGADPNDKEDKEFESLTETPMFTACYQDDMDMLQLLIRYGGRLDNMESDHSTLLHIAAIHNGYHCVEFLIENGFDVNARNDSGSTPLHHAQCSRGLESTNLLLAHGAEVNAVDRSKWTPLHNAVFHNHGKAVTLLLAHGADIDAQDVHGKTPLHFAIVKCTTIALFNSNGEAYDYDVEPQWIAFKALLKHHPNLELRNEQGDTPLLFATRESQKGMMKRLINRGANIRARSTSDGKCTLDIIKDKYYYNLSHRWPVWYYLEMLDVLYPHLNDEEKKIVDECRKQSR